MNLIIFIFLISLTIYVFTLFLFNFGAKNIAEYSSQNLYPNVSVIVAIRNGGKSLLNLINDLEKQDYKGIYEIILVDDNSSDDTDLIIKNSVKNNNIIKYVHSKEGNPKLTYKKRALDAGIKNASFDILLFTDVDCKIPSGWIKSMASTFKPNTEYVIGLSKIIPTKTYTSRFQSLDFQMLETASIAMAALGQPWACTGQNQAYKKSLYKEVGGFKKISTFLQGDDTLFLQICKNNSAKISYVSNPKSIVTGRTENKWKNLIKQRMRWSGDLAKMYLFNSIFFFIAISTFLLNGLFCFIFFIDFPLIYSISGLLLKFIAEYFLYNTGNTIFENPKRKNTDFYLWFVLQIPFVFFMGLCSLWAQPILGWQTDKT